MRRSLYSPLCCILLTVSLLGACKKNVLPPTLAGESTPPPIETLDPVDLPALMAEFEAEKDEGRRLEILYQLAADSRPEAREHLARLYRTAPEWKIHVIQSLTFNISYDLAPSLNLLRDALAPGQPAELRTAAADTLRDLDDKRTLPLWQALLQDPDETLRDLAQNMVEYFQP